jgi:predicted esterase
MLIGGLIVAAAGLGVLALSRSSSKGSGSSSSSSSGPAYIVTDDLAELDAIMIEAGFSPNLRRFCAMTAQGESGLISNMYLGRPQLQPPGTVLSPYWEDIGESEYQATVDAYDSLAEIYSACPWPKSRYTVAGGLFGFLAPYGVYAYRNTSLKCIDPWSIYDAVEAVVMFYDMLRRISGNPRMSINGDWLDLRCGVGALARIGVPEKRAAMAAKLEDRGTLKKLGVPKAWLYEKIEPLPKVDLLELRARLLAKFRPKVPGPNPAPTPDSTTQRTINLGGLETIELVTGGAGLDDDLPIVVGLHGRGGSSSAMAEVVRSMPEPFRFLLPNAPGSGSSRSWWGPSTGSATAEVIAAAMPPAADVLVPMLIAVEATYGRVPMLFGHSQGAMLAYLIAAQHGTLVRLVVAVSGWLPPPLYPAPPQYQTVYWPMIVGIHGETDDVVPLDYDVDTLTAFEHAGAEVDFYAETGLGHALGPLWTLARDVLIAGAV